MKIAAENHTVKSRIITTITLRLLGRNGLLDLLENSVVAFVLISWQQEVSHQSES